MFYMQEPFASIVVHNSPLPRTFYNEQRHITNQSLTIGLVFCLALAFLPASIVSYIVKERFDSIKETQIYAGLDIAMYWVTFMLIDGIKYVFLSLFSFLMIFAFDLELYLKDGMFVAVVLLFFMHGWSMLSFTYMCSFLFKTPGMAQLGLFFFNFFFGVLAPLFV